MNAWRPTASNALLSQLSMIDRRIDQKVRLLLTLQKVAEERERAEDLHQEKDKDRPSPA
jgi:hypothetical protein